MIRDLLIILGALLTIVSVLPYLLDIIHRRTKPRIVSWFNWTVLTGIGGVAALMAHQYPAAILSLAGSLETALVVVVGLRHGDRKFDTTDVLCQAGAIMGLILWAVFDSPAVAVIAVASIDFIAAIPTIKHSWQKPQEETATTYILCCIGAALTLAAIRTVSFTALTYPIYLFGINLLESAILLGRRPHKR